MYSQLAKLLGFSLKLQWSYIYVEEDTCPNLDSGQADHVELSTGLPVTSRRVRLWLSMAYRNFLALRPEPWWLDSWFEGEKGSPWTLEDFWVVEDDSVFASALGIQWWCFHATHHRRMAVASPLTAKVGVHTLVDTAICS
jgi:hypothetical protein